MAFDKNRGIDKNDSLMKKTQTKNPKIFISKTLTCSRRRSGRRTVTVFHARDHVAHFDFACAVFAAIVNRRRAGNSAFSKLVEAKIVQIVVKVAVTPPSWIRSIFVDSESRLHNSFDAGRAITQKFRESSWTHKTTVFVKHFLVSAHSVTCGNDCFELLCTSAVDSI